MRLGVMLRTLILVVAAPACVPTRDPLRPPAADFLTENIDPGTSPREDFFRYAMGGWLRRNPIPDDRAVWGIGNVADEDLYLAVRRASETATARDAPRGSPARLVGDFWFTGMDSTTINRQALTLLRPDLERIDAVQSMSDVIEIVALLHRRSMLVGGATGGYTGPRTLFAMHVEQDERDSRRAILSLSGGGISIGAGAYTATDTQRTKVRGALRTYLRKTFLRLGRDSAAAQRSASAVFDLEARIAAGLSGRDEYRMVSVPDLDTLAPSLDWTRYFRVLGAPRLDSVNVRRPLFFQRLDALARTVPLETWRDYLRFCLVRSHASFLDDGAYGEQFSFDSTFTGARRPQPRWKRVAWEEKYWLGQPLAQLIANEYFPASVKIRDVALGEALRAAFRDRIAQADWMSESTKQHAQQKLARLRISVGMPEQWLDVGTMPLRRDSYVLNMIRSAEWFTALDMKRLTRPIAPTDPDPQYNVGGDAYYDNGANEVWLPSPIVVAGRSAVVLDDAFIHGSTSLGHEISHAFDSNGRYYDAYGNKVDWWTAMDSAAFEARAQALVDEYDAMLLPGGGHINGRRTLAENIADLVGVRIALDAFKHTAQYRRNEKVAGFTPLQRFFLAYAYSDACSERPAYLLRIVASSSYAPCRERVNGVLMNIPEFYEAFGVKPGDAMYRAEAARARIW